MMKKYILALDLGTTGNRAIIFDRNQREVAKAYQEFRQIFPKSGWVEHDPIEIWRSTLSVTKKALSRISLKDVAAIGITNQRETTIVWNRFTGKPVMNAIVWQCRRTQAECEALKRRGFSKKIKFTTGLTIDPYFSSTKVQWILNHVGGAKKQAKRGDLLFGTVDSWIVWNLTGGRTHTTDPSNASRTMLYDIRSMNWDDSLCGLFDIPTSMLPKISDSSGEAAVTSKKMIGAEIPITGIIGDQQAAMFAQGCFEPGIVKNTYGTGLFLQMNTGRKIPSSRNLLNTIAWKIGSQVDYALEGSVFIGGACIQWLRDGLQLIQKSNQADKLADQITTNEGVYFVPALVGLGAPYWDSRARGIILGLTRGTTRAHIARAALESIAYQTKDVVSEMERSIGYQVKKLQVDGGASQSNLLMQFQSDILNAKIERPRIIETTALGAAALAGLAVGLWKNPKHFLRQRQVDRTFKPRMTKTKREQFYKLWQNAVSRSLGWAKEPR